MMPKEGLAMVFFLLFASLPLLVPVSLVSAKLATGWPKNGGVYRWVWVCRYRRYSLGT